MKFNYVLCTLLIVSGAAQAAEQQKTWEAPLEKLKSESQLTVSPVHVISGPEHRPSVVLPELPLVAETEQLDKDSLGSETPVGTITLDLSRHLTEINQRINAEKEKQAQTPSPAVLSGLLEMSASPAAAQLTLEAASATQAARRDQFVQNRGTSSLPPINIVSQADLEVEASNMRKPLLSPTATAHADKGSASASSSSQPRVEKDEKFVRRSSSGRYTDIRPKRNWKWFGIGAGVVAVAAAAIIYYLKWHKPASAAR